MNMTQLINNSLDCDMIKDELEQKQFLRLPVVNQLISTGKKKFKTPNSNYKKHVFNVRKIEKQGAKENTN